MPKPSATAKPLSVLPKRVTSFEPRVAKAFGDAVRALRLQTGLAQDEFALIANVDRSYYGKLERGQRQPSLALLLRIASALGLTGAQLVGYVEPLMDAADEGVARVKRRS